MFYAATGVYIIYSRGRMAKVFEFDLNNQMVNYGFLKRYFSVK